MKRIGALLGPGICLLGFILGTIFCVLSAISRFLGAVLDAWLFYMLFGIALMLFCGFVNSNIKLIVIFWHKYRAGRKRRKAAKAAQKAEQQRKSSL